MGRQQLKGWIAGGLRWSGLNRLREWVGPAQLTAITYHRVLPLPEALRYPFQAMVTTRDVFEAQMAYLARNYRVLEFPEAIRALQRGQLPRRAVVVTFDDGYRDNYEHAWPILKKYRVPATFFLVTGALDRRIRLWWDEVAEAIQRLSDHPSSCGKEEHNLPGWIGALLETLDDGRGAQTISQEVVDRLNSLPLEERKQSLEALYAFADLASNERPDLMLTWEQVHELHRSGMHIGAHTVTHAFLDELDTQEAWHEISGSIERLHGELGVPVRLLSYPRGRGRDESELLQHAGIEAALTTEPGRNGPGADLLKLKRLDAGYCCLTGGFDPAVFEVELGGWFKRFHRG